MRILPRLVRHQAECRMSSADSRSFAGSGLMLLALALGVLLAGCATGDYTYVTRISTGERMEFPLVKGAPKKARQGEFEVLHAGVLPTPDRSQKKLLYLFALSVDSGTAPRSVLVEDVSGDGVTVLMEDLAPKMEGKRWSNVTKLYEATDPELSWLGQLGDIMRVYRFTVTTADGKKVVLHQGWLVAGWMKAAMRSSLGLPPL